MDDRWKPGDKRRMSPTRLWRELPQSRKTESHRKLGPPWKKQGNPPLKDRKTDAEPKAPRTPPPRTTAKPKARPGVCRAATPTENRRQEEEDEAELETVDLEEDNDQDMTTEDALAVWQALLEMQQGEEFNIASPILPTHVADNIVETLVDRPEAQHNLLSDTLPLFLSRVHRDLARALERARNLRSMLGRAGSSTDPPNEAGPPEAEQEAEEGCFMQTTIEASTAAAASREDLLLQRLHRALQSLGPRSGQCQGTSAGESTSRPRWPAVCGPLAARKPSCSGQRRNPTPRLRRSPPGRTCLVCHLVEAPQRDTGGDRRGCRRGIRRDGPATCTT